MSVTCEERYNNQSICTAFWFYQKAQLQGWAPRQHVCMWSDRFGKVSESLSDLTITGCACSSSHYSHLGHPSSSLIQSWSQYLYLLFALGHTDYLWITQSISGTNWVSVKNAKLLWITVSIYGTPWESVAHIEYLWHTLSICGPCWVFGAHAVCLGIMLSFCDPHRPQPPPVFQAEYRTLPWKRLAGCALGLPGGASGRQRLRSNTERRPGWLCGDIESDPHGRVSNSTGAGCRGRVTCS